MNEKPNIPPAELFTGMVIPQHAQVPLRTDVATLEGRQLSLGQGGGPPAIPLPLTTQPPGPPQAPPQGPPSASPEEMAQVVPGKCPGPIEMPDGRIIEPEDPLTFTDLCELLPFLAEAMQLFQQVQAEQKARGITPGQAVPVAGGITQTGRPIAGPGQFGPQAGVSGSGPVSYPVNPGGFIGSGGGGAGARGPQGAAGPSGPSGPPGYGAEVSRKIKTDGDFTAGPGAFIAIPGTKITFSTKYDGPATFFIQAVLGNGAVGLSQNAQLGLRIDGADTALAPRLLHTMAAGVGEFQTGHTQVWVKDLTKGSHTVEVLLRGLAVGEFGGGLGTPAGVTARGTSPLALIILHR